MNRTNTVSIGSFLADLDSGTDFRLVTDIVGWDDAPPARLELVDQPAADGAFDAAGLYGPRVITVTGLVDQQTHAGAQAVADELNAISPHSAYAFEVSKDDGGGTRSALVRPSQSATLEWANGTTFTYTIQLVARDPLKYGPEAIASASLDDTAGGAGRVWVRVWPRDWGVAAGVTPGAATVPNVGTASYHPRLRIDGPVTNPVVRLAESGASLRYNGTVPSGTWLDVVCADRVVLLRGLVSHRHLVSFEGDWLSIPPGGGTVSWSADSFGDGHSLTIFGTEGAWA